MNNLGFNFDTSKITGILTVFIIYTVCILAIGVYVKIREKNMSATDKFLSFLNGGGNLGAVALAMLIVTNGLSSGAVIGGPGLGYSTGFIWSICVFAGFMNSLFLLATIGKKMAIMRQRTGITSLISALGHRYESKALPVAVGIAMVVFLVPNISAQLQGGAKLFAVASGTGNYNLGLLIFAGVTILYTVSGGMKSLARVAVVQGFIMLISVVLLYVSTRMGLAEQYGTFENAMRFLAEEKPSMVTAWTYMPLYAIGAALTMSFAITAIPASVCTTFTYNKSKTLARSIAISTVAYVAIQGIMSGLGPLGYASIQTLTSGDYVNPYLTSINLPSLLAGIVVAGTTSAIQSTAAALMLVAATTIIKDIYVGQINPNADIDKVNKSVRYMTLGIGVVALIMALFPTSMMQYLINFSNGGYICCIWAPLVLGLYSKKVTSKGATWSVIIGTGSYLILYLIGLDSAASAAFKAATGNCHPVLIGLAAAIISMLAVSKFSKKVKLGTLQVWFGKTYNEKYAK